MLFWIIAHITQFWESPSSLLKYPDLFVKSVVFLACCLFQIFPFFFTSLLKSFPPCYMHAFNSFNNSLTAPWFPALLASPTHLLIYLYKCFCKSYHSYFMFPISVLDNLTFNFSWNSSLLSLSFNFQSFILAILVHINVSSLLCLNSAITNLWSLSRFTLGMILISVIASMFERVYTR